MFSLGRTGEAWILRNTDHRPASDTCFTWEHAVFLFDGRHKLKVNREMLSIVVIAIILIAALFFGLLSVLYRRSIYNSDEQKNCPVQLPPGKDYNPYHPQMLALVDEMFEQPFEWIKIRSWDGLDLYGRYLHVKDGAPVAIQVHGYRSWGMRDFCGGNKIARENGINTLLIQQRAHGKSGGHTLTFGIKERYDLLDWIRYVLKRFGDDTEIILAGISMGAATVLMASELDLPKNVRGITADSSYTSPEAIVRKVIRQNGLSDKVFFPLVNLSAMLFGHVNLKEASPIEAVKKAKVPILLLHGTDDRFVPYPMGLMLQDACTGPVRFESFKGAPHGIGYILEPERYERIMLDFFREIL